MSNSSTSLDARSKEEHQDSIKEKVKEQSSPAIRTLPALPAVKALLETSPLPVTPYKTPVPEPAQQMYPSMYYPYQMMQPAYDYRFPRYVYGSQGYYQGNPASSAYQYPCYQTTQLYTAQPLRQTSTQPTAAFGMDRFKQ